MTLRLIAGAALVALTAGCGTAAPAAAPPPPQAVVTAAPTSAPVSVPHPAHLRFAAVGVDADLDATGLDATGAIAVPPLDHAAEVDYLNWAPAIAAGRPTIVVSHVNGRSAAGAVLPGGFGRLRDAKPGDLLTLTDSTGTTTTYRVTSERLVDKTAFPTSIYDPRPVPTVVLITCGGQIHDHNFLSNVLVEAVAA